MGKEIRTKSVDVDPYGKLYEKSALFLRQHVGEAAAGDDRKYEMSLNMGGSHPIVQSKKTGKWFTLSWQDILNMAVQAGIDEEGELGEAAEEAQDEDDS